MTIDANINKNLDKVSEATQDLSSTLQSESNIEQQQELGFESPVDEPSVFTEDEPIQVAGVGRSQALEIAKDAAKKIVKEKLGKKGTRVERDPEVTKPTQVIEETAEDAVPVSTEKPPKIKPQEDPIKQQYDTVTDESIEEIAKKRERILEEGTERVKPGDVEGVDINRISTLPYDDASTAASAKASSQQFLKSNPKVRTVDDVFAEAERRGIDVVLLKKVAAGKGIDVNTNLGSGKAGDLPEKIAGFIKLHDDNVQILDDLFEKRQSGKATDVDNYNLKQHLLWHQEILKGMSNVQTDVAVSLNLFKRASAEFKGKSNVAAKQLEDMTAEGINENTLTEFTTMWNSTPTIGGKNKLVMHQQSFAKDIADDLYLTYKTNLLSGPDTLMDNFVGATVTGIKTNLDDWSGAIWGSARRTILNQPITREDIIIDDILNGYVGMRNTIIESAEFAGKTLKTGKRAGYKSDISLKDTWLQKYSNRSDIPFLNKVIKKTPSADNIYWQSLIKGVSFFPNLILKTMGAGDEFAGAMFSRMKLHTEASRYSRNRMADLIVAGKSTDDAYSITANEVQSFLKSQPANIYKNVEQAREFINLRYRFANEVKDVDILGIKGPTVEKIASFPGKAYNYINHKVAQADFVRYMIPFSNSLTRIFEMTAANIPGLSALSPTYWEDKAAGGSRRDRANARMALGSSLLLGFFNLAEQGVITGAGPSDKKLSNTLKARGRQNYSIRLGKSQYTKQDVSTIKRILNEDEYKVAKNGDLYISFERLDNLAFIAAMAADFVEYTTFNRDNYNSSESQNMAYAMLGSTYNFLSNQIWLEQIGDFVTSLQRADNSNAGKMAANLVEQSFATGGANLLMGVPIVSSLGYSSLARKFATTWDEEKKSYDPDVMNVDNSNIAEQFLSDTFIRMRQNSPLLRGELNTTFDSLGRVVMDEEFYVDTWMKHFPGVRMSKERGEKIDRIMEVYQVGVANPDRVIEGVRLSATQYEKYKRLYGNDIKLPVVDQKTGKQKNVNLRDALLTEISNKIYRIENSQGPYKKELVKEDLQKLIDMNVSKYRSAARARMFGDPVKVKVSADAEVTRYENFYTDPITKQRKTTIIFPELNREINSFKNFKRRQ